MKNENAPTEMKIFDAWLDDNEATVFYTHQRVDADAAFSAALILVAKPDATVFFVPADTVVDDEDEIAVDMLNGQNAVKGLKQGSAFGLIVESLAKRDQIWQQAFGKWAKQLNLTDSGKKCKDSVLLIQLVRSWRQSGHGDQSIVNRAHEILNGHFHCIKAEQASRKRARDHPIQDGIAVILDGQSPDRRSLFQRGAKAIIYHGESAGQCVMLSPKVMRKNGRTLGELDGHLPDHWFIHPQGFLAAHGTKKAPQPLSTSGITLDELRTLLIDWFGGNLPEETNLDDDEISITPLAIETVDLIPEDAHTHANELDPLLQNANEVVQIATYAIDKINTNSTKNMEIIDILTELSNAVSTLRDCVSKCSAPTDDQQLALHLATVSLHAVNETFEQYWMQDGRRDGKTVLRIQNINAIWDKSDFEKS